MALLLVLGVIAVPVALIGVAKGRKIVGSIRAGYDEREITRLLAGKDVQQAASVLAAAMDHSRDDPRLLRLLDDLLVETKAPGGDRLANLRKLLRSPEVQPGDRLRMARAALEAGDMQTANREILLLPEAVRTGRDALWVKAALLAHEGKPEESAALYRSIHRAHPQDQEAARTVALLDIRSAFKEERASARARLLDIASGSGDVAMKALLDMTAMRNLEAAEARRMLALADAMPDLPPLARLRVVQAGIKACPADADALLAGVMRKAQAGTTDDRSLIFHWMIENGHARIVIPQIQPAEAASDGRMYLALLDALRAQKRWEEMRSVLSIRPPSTIPREQHTLLLADCDLLSGDSAAGVAKIQQIVAASKKTGNEGGIRMALGLADKFALDEIAIECQEFLAQFVKGNKIPLLDGLYARLEKRGDSARMLATLKSMLAEMPDHPEARQKLDYLRLLTGIEIELASPREEDSAGPADRLNRALNAYRTGRLEELGSALTGIKRWDALTPGQRAIAAGLLKHTGHEIEALRLWENIPNAEMLPEERVFAGRLVASQL